jgi:soluble lytic murein transglycosylase-like protein
MAHATDYALRGHLPAVARAAAQFVKDVGTGFMATSRVLVTLVGCITLVGASVVLANASWRDRLVEEVPAALAALVPSLGVAEAQAAETDRSAANEPVPAVVTDPQQRHVTQYLARRYRVADEAVRMLVAAAYEAGQEKQLDPLLILAVMAVESSMNPFAQSSMGAQGLMQVMTRVHTDKFQPHGGDQAALDPIANIKVGSAILQDLVRRGGSVERGLQLYVGAGNLEDDGGYAARVLGERARIAMAATGKVDSALAAGMRSDVTRPEIKPVVEVVKPQTDAAEAPAAGSEPVKPADRAA